MDQNIYISTLKTTMEAVLQAMSYIPNYNQSKREEFLNLQLEIREEQNKPYGRGENCRDDAKLMALLEKANLLMLLFKEEIKQREI